MTQQTSSLAAAVDALLKANHGVALDAWLAEAEASGRPLRDLAQELAGKTGIPVSHETLRRWFKGKGSTAA